VADDGAAASSFTYFVARRLSAFPYPPSLQGSLLLCSPALPLLSLSRTWALFLEMSGLIIRSFCEFRFQRFFEIQGPSAGIVPRPRFRVLLLPSCPALVYGCRKPSWQLMARFRVWLLLEWVIFFRPQTAFFFPPFLRLGSVSCDPPHALLWQGLFPYHDLPSAEVARLRRGSNPPEKPPPS